MALNTCLDGQQVESAVMGRKRKPDKLFADFSSLVNEILTITSCFRNSAVGTFINFHLMN